MGTWPVEHQFPSPFHCLEIIATPETQPNKCHMHCAQSDQCPQREHPVPVSSLFFDSAGE